MKSALFRDTFREIKRSVSRFVSIFAIIALGCGFFSGIKATMPDMVESAEKYFDEQHLMDLRLMSSIGVRSEDVDAVRKADNVLAAVPGYSKDVFYFYNNQNIVLKAMSLPNEMKGDMNTVVLLEGRLPEKSGECVVERKVNSPDTFKVGNTLKLSAPTESEDINDIFTTDTFEIVGVVTSPLFIGYERGATNVGNGEVQSYIMLSEQDFVLDYYSELYLRLDGVSGLDQFSDEYTDEVNIRKREAVEAFHNSVTARYEKLKSDAKDKIDSAKEELLTYESVLAMSGTDLDSYLASAENQLADAQKQYDAIENKNSITALFMQSRIVKGEKQIAELRRLNEAEKNGDPSVRQELAFMMEQSKAQIASAEEELENAVVLTFYEQDRFSSTDYASFKGDAEKIDAIAKVFPAFFLLIVALVTLTTMTRMIDEQRTVIGTYKALGYSVGQIMFKYLFYAFTASILGSCIGTVIGLQVFPSIIYDSYKIMYNIPEIDTPFRLSYMLLCMAASVLCTGAAVMYASLRTLRSQPSQLMRPKPPASGRRVLLERVGFVWNRLSFLMKVTVRNLLRYKKRFFMTIAGVAGCTALIITGFGLKHSIKSIADKQFGEVFDFSATVITAAETNEQAYEALDALKEMPQVEKASLYASIVVDGSANGTTQSVSLIVPREPEGFLDYVRTADTDSEENVSISGSEVLVTEKLARLLDLSTGDEITVRSTELPERQLKVKAVVKNYALHYIYMSPEGYDEIFGGEPLYRMAFINTAKDTDELTFKEKLISDSRFLGIAYKGDSSKGFLNSVDSLDSIVLLLIFCAGLLAIIVLYNLANINITERVREIATVKVLGFFDIETSAYIYRENIISSLLGIVIGLFLGKLLHYFVVITSEVDIVLFNRELVWWAYLLGALLTIVFAVLVNIVLHFKLKRIDMVESLKSIE